MGKNFVFGCVLAFCSVFFHLFCFKKSRHKKLNNSSTLSKGLWRPIAQGCREILFIPAFEKLGGTLYLDLF